MFQLVSWITLSETDATDVIFFPKLLEKCIFVLESFLMKEKTSIKIFIEESFFFPVVHSELNFYHPLLAGDKVTIQLELLKLGNTSITFSYNFLNSENVLVAKAMITHVLVSKNTRKKHPFPENLRTLLEKI